MTDRSQQLLEGVNPGDHFVHIYDDTSLMLETLANFVAAGFHAGDGVVIIATRQHLTALEAHLLNRGYRLNDYRATHQYQTFDAVDTLSKFMVNDWPDEKLFRDTMSEVLVKARGNGRPLRLFGEMVAILWANGLSAATLRLENLW